MHEIQYEQQEQLSQQQLIKHLKQQNSRLTNILIETKIYYEEQIRNLLSCIEQYKQDLSEKQQIIQKYIKQPIQSLKLKKQQQQTHTQQQYQHKQITIDNNKNNKKRHSKRLQSKIIFRAQQQQQSQQQYQQDQQVSQEYQQQQQSNNNNNNNRVKYVQFIDMTQQMNKNEINSLAQYKYSEHQIKSRKKIKIKSIIKPSRIVHNQRQHQQKQKLSLKVIKYAQEYNQQQQQKDIQQYYPNEFQQPPYNLQQTPNHPITSTHNPLDYSSSHHLIPPNQQQNSQKIQQLQRCIIQLKHEIASSSHKIAHLFNAAFQYGGSKLLDFLSKAIGLEEKSNKSI